MLIRARIILMTLCLAALGCGDVNDGTGGAAGTGGTTVATLAVTVTGAVIRARKGATTSAVVTVARGDGLEGPVSIVLQGAPIGLAASPTTIAPEADTGALDITTVLTATDGGPTIVTLIATLTPDGQTPIEARTEVPLWVVGEPLSNDPSFCSGGLGINGTGELRHAALDPSGRVVLMTGPAARTLMRLGDNGCLDEAFGTRGRLEDAARNSTSLAALSQDNRILVATSSAGPGQPAVIRSFSATDGMVDTSFGTDGEIESPFGTVLLPTARGFLAVTPGSVQGFTFDGGADSEITNASIPYQFGDQTHVDSTGRFVMMRRYFAGTPSAREMGVEITRLLSSGEPDPTLGTNGIAVLPEERSPDDFTLFASSGVSSEGDGVVVTITFLNSPLDPIHEANIIRFFDDGNVNAPESDPSLVSLRGNVAVAADGRAIFPADVDGPSGMLETRMRVVAADGGSSEDLRLLRDDALKTILLVEPGAERLVLVEGFIDSVTVKRFWL